MLKKRKSPQDEMQHKEENVSAESNTAPKAAAPPARANKENTIIGEKISIEGIIRGKENLIIEGIMKGNIELEKNKLTIGKRGQVEADIQAQDVTISGRLAGNIKAKGKVEVTKQADFSGEILTHQISVEDGAFIKATIEMGQTSQKDSTSKENSPVQLVSPAGKETTNALNNTDKEDN